MKQLTKKQQLLKLMKNNCNKNTINKIPLDRLMKLANELEKESIIKFLISEGFSRLNVTNLEIQLVDIIIKGSNKRLKEFNKKYSKKGKN